MHFLYMRTSISMLVKSFIFPLREKYIHEYIIKHNNAILYTFSSSNVRTL